MIHQSDNYGHRGSTMMLRYVSNLGEVKRTEGVDNEIEMLWSSTLMRDVVTSLKLYTDYRVKEGRRKRQVYATQPVSADLDRFHLDSIDKIAYEDFCTITMQLKRKSEQDSTILVKGAEKALTDVGRQQSVRNRLFKLLLQRREENSIALSSTSNHGKLIDEPLVEGQIRPNLWKAYGIALGVGIGCPFAIFYLLGFLKYKIENRKDLEEMTERPIIAEVPLAGDDVKQKAGIVIRSGINEPITEAFRLMRTNIHFMLKGEENTILFTSSTSGEGKSFCAANLAMSCALLGKRVVLCGMDLRRPALGQLFMLEDRDKGLTNLLGMEEITEADVFNQIVPSGTDRNLDLLQAGPIPPNPAELLARESFGQVMAILKKAYDYVILDTAPVGLVTDTLPIGRYADVTVFVCRAEYTPNYAVAQLNQLSIENKLPNTCFVFNGYCA
jgi:capsular exopolysaccharide synthesis family protein